MKDFILKRLEGFLTNRRDFLKGKIHDIQKDGEVENELLLAEYQGSLSEIETLLEMVVRGDI